MLRKLSTRSEDVHDMNVGTSFFKLWEFYRRISAGVFLQSAMWRDVPSWLENKPALQPLKKYCFVFGLHEKQNSVKWT